MPVPNMMSAAAELEAASEELLAALGAVSMDQLALSLPSSHTSDVHILSAEKILSELKDKSLSLEQSNCLLWEAFHQLSVTHSTLFHHRHQQRMLRQSISAQKKKTGSTVPVEATLEDPQQLPAASPQDTRDRMSSLPSDWTVVQLSLGIGDDIEPSIGRLLCRPAPIFTLHLSRASAGPRPSLIIQSLAGCEGELLEEMERIKEQNKVLNKTYADDAAKYGAMRNQLDARLKRLMLGIEAWLGSRKWMMSGSPPDLAVLTNTVTAAASKAGLQLTDQQLDALVLVMSCPSVQLGSQDRTSSTAHYMLRGALCHVLGERKSSPAVLSLYEQLLLCKDDFKAARQAERGPVILILDKSVVSLPWESLSFMRDQPVTRMPNLHTIFSLYQSQCEPSSILQRGIDCSNGYYLLDPENNLSRTQQRLLPALTATGWPGMAGTRPSHKQFKDALSNSDVFMYLGHGSGSQYLPGDLVEDVSCRSAVLLYGCSSVKLQPRGYTPDPWGVLLNYLLANCPCVLGMLWEVTDKDTDLMTATMLATIAKARAGTLTGPSDLATLVAQHRLLCNRTMTAVAIVLYGLPCSFRVASSSSSS